MANLATITYKVTGTRKAVNNLWTTFQNMRFNEQSKSINDNKTQRINVSEC